MSLPTAPLAKALRQNQEYIGTPEPRLYKKLSVKLYGRGVVLDTPADGATLKMQKHQLAKPGQVIVSEIWGKKGALGIVPHEGEGALCTSHFFLFDLDHEAAAPEWIRLILDSNYLEEQLDGQARGTTGYAAVRPKHFLAAMIPFPSLSEQKRIATKVQESLVALDRAAALYAQTVADFDRLLIALAHRDDLTDEQKRERGWRKLRLGDVMHLDLDPVKVDPSRNYPNLGIYSFAKGLFEKPPISGLATSAAVLNRVKSGQFIFSRLFAFEGSYGYVSADFDGFYVSGEYPTFTCIPGECRAEFVYAHFKPERVWQSLSAKSKGLGLRRQRVQPPAILAHEAWVPPMPEQDRIAEVLTAQRNFAASDTFKKDAEALRRSILSKAFRGEL